MHGAKVKIVNALQWMLHTGWFKRKGKYSRIVTVGHCEKKKVHMNVCPILNCYRERAVWIYKYKSILSGSK